MRKLFLVLLVGLINFMATVSAQAENYVIDREGTHAFIQFKIKHLGYSWLYGQFKKFSGEFSYDEADPSKSKVSIIIETSSLDSNHAKRDKHLRGDEFLDVKKYPRATFVSTSYKELDNGRASLKGDFTLHGVTKNITINVEHIGHGKDPWGGYRRGLYGTVRIKPADYGLKGMSRLGASSAELFLELSLEGIRQSVNKK